MFVPNDKNTWMIVEDDGCSGDRCISICNDRINNSIDSFVGHDLFPTLVISYLEKMAFLAKSSK